MKILEFLKNVDTLNLVLLAITILFGAWWKMGRHKLKLMGEFFLKAYEYTDDKILTKEERADLLSRVMQIIKVKNLHIEPPEPAAPELQEGKKRRRAKLLNK